MKKVKLNVLELNTGDKIIAVKDNFFTVLWADGSVHQYGKLEMEEAYNFPSNYNLPPLPEDDLSEWLEGILIPGELRPLQIEFLHAYPTQKGRGLGALLADAENNKPEFIPICTNAEIGAMSVDELAALINPMKGWECVLKSDPLKLYFVNGFKITGLIGVMDFENTYYYPPEEVSIQPHLYAEKLLEQYSK